ncbi:hypothetical protein HN018_15485 [Lichenicola cladoniae]|uniref:Uncharacterized protein n=1 Tax=Lichenicola cladoniae TaxID=1484109 RepID=A0A6M8HSV4_9PROT|nr:hypothetical protein [Lichenicola cladoniae]NPD65718.1 hypothetical protein [Acetobacteraceae bacterium]QKE91261.1 hypothetical protein HN018_15485 [Lichenicola cladoniae]
MGGIRTGNQRASAVEVRTLIPIMVAVLLGVMTMSDATAATSDPSLCKSGETSLFTCPIGHKLVSVCSDGTKATYYFGTSNRIELSSQALSIADHMFSGGGETQISVSHGAYSYIVYDKITRTSFAADGRNDPGFTSGLVVQKNGKTVSSKQCGLDATISSDAHHVIQPGPFIEH